MTVRPAAVYLALAAILIAALYGCGGNATYSKPELEIRGTTNTDRIRSIAEEVEKRYDKFVAVPSADIVTDEGDHHAAYLVMVTVPARFFSGNPDTQSDAERQREAGDKFNSATVDLLRLSAQHLVPNDVTLQTVSLRVFFPDGDVIDASAEVQQLKTLKQDSPEQAWLEALTTDPQIVVPNSLWEQLVSTARGAASTTPGP